MIPRILHVTTVPQTLRFLVGHVAYAKKQGFDVQILSSPGEELATFQRIMDVEAHAVEMPRRITPFRDLAAVWRMRRVMRRVQPTIVDGHTPKGGLLAMMSATLCRVPVRVYHMHGLPLVTATGMRRRLLRWAERTSCALAHEVLSVSESVRGLAIAEGLCSAEKIKVLDHGAIDGIEAQGAFNRANLPVDIGQQIRQRYHIPSDAPLIGFVGRVVRDKGVIELVRAWHTLREEYPALHLLVAGPFESEDPIPADVNDALRNDPRIHCAGMVHDMPELYAALDILVLPTYREGLSISLLEASALEVPIVATRIPGVVDAVRDGETALLAPVQDVPALTSAIRCYLNDADLRRRHGAAGRRHVLSDFDPETLRHSLCQEYRRLLGVHAAMACRALPLKRMPDAEPHMAQRI